MHPGGIQLVHGGDLLFLDVHARLHREFRRCDELILGAADGVHHRFDRQSLVVDVQLLHALRDLLLHVVHVADGEIAVVADLTAVAAQELEADRVEGAGHQLRGLRAVLAEELFDPLLDLARRLIGERDRHDGPCRGRIHGKFREVFSQRVAVQRLRLFHLGQKHPGVLRDYGIVVRVAVAGQIRQPVDQHRGFSASGAG